MIPDKVSAIETERGIKWFIGEAPSSWGPTVYISRDALLEWLKSSGYEETDRISVETLIDKINSM